MDKFKIKKEEIFNKYWSILLILECLNIFKDYHDI